MMHIRPSWTTALLLLSLLRLAVGADSGGLTTGALTTASSATSPTPTICWTLKTPKPSGVYCGGQYYIEPYNNSHAIQVARFVNSNADCAQLCGYYPGCTGFSNIRGCVLATEPLDKMTLHPNFGPPGSLWSMECYQNAHCPPIHRKSPPPCRTNAPQFVRDGSFEHPLANSSWVSNSPNITIMNNQTMAFAGSQYANFTVYAGKSVLLEQQLTGLDVYQWYNISAAIGVTLDTSSGQCDFEVSIDGQSPFLGATSRGSQTQHFHHWNRRSVRFRAPRKNPLLQVSLVCQYPDGYLYDYVNYLLDDVTIRCSP